MTQSFLDKGWKFPIKVDPVSGYMQMVRDEEDVKEAILIILRTVKGERVKRPQFGCGIHAFVFETTDAAMLRLMEESVKEAIVTWEPRVERVAVEVKLDPAEHAKVLIHLQYAIRSTNSVHNLVYPFYLYEGGS